MPRERPTVSISCWLFLRLLGAVYLIALISLWTQVLGLVGHDGIMPAAQLLQAAREQLGSARYWFLPTVCWLNASDQVLQGLCGLGVFASVLLILDIAPAATLAVLWVCYLSLATVCREFLWFQWDSLLLEAGFLAIFLAPLRVGPRRGSDPTPSPFVVWLLRWLLFRLMFSSGVVKLASGDPTWRHLTALTYHYETQPLPTWTSWYAHQLPAWFHHVACAGMFAIELLAPLLILGPRRVLLVACAALVTLQGLIMATGNYGYFNLLALVLCVVLLDDAVWPAAWRAWLNPPRREVEQVSSRRWPRWIVIPLGVGLLLLTLVPMVGLSRGRLRPPAPLIHVYGWLEPLRLVSNYGLFAVMTTSRPEILIEGSDDQVEWRAYEFTDKPGDVGRPPRFVAPHQPRLDWQMWFAALGRYQDNPWFLNFCRGLLEGSSDVLALLAKNPFPDAPPRYLRATVYDYHFTDPATKRATGQWWRREPKGLYCPILSLARD